MILLSFSFKNYIISLSPGGDIGISRTVMNHYLINRTKSLGASLSVEAALVFPVFFYAVMALCCLFMYMETRAAVQNSMLEAARSISVYGDMIEEAEEKVKKKGPAGIITAELLEGISAEYLVRDRLKEYPIAVNMIKGGLSGITASDTELLTSDGCIRLVCRYKLKNPVPLLRFAIKETEQSVLYRYFTGRKAECLLEEIEEEEKEENEETVYVTETGTVYHLELTCPSLKLNISEIPAQTVGQRRNEGGGKYYPCEKCASGSCPDYLFITTDGDRYHYRINCSGLKRTVREIKKSEAGDRRPCKRCGEKK